MGKYFIHLYLYIKTKLVKLLMRGVKVKYEYKTE